MNILMFNYEYPPLGGGGGVVHELIAEELANRHRISVITSGGMGLPRRESRNGVEIYRVPVLGRSASAAASLSSMLTYPLGAWLQAAVLMGKQRFDIINSHFAVPTGPGSLPPARIANVPHVLSVHGGDIFDPTKRLSPHRIAPLRATVGAVLRGSDAVVAQSSNTRDNTYRYYRFKGPIEIIPLGIRVPATRTATRSQLGLPESSFIAVTVGRLVRRKAVDALLRVLARADCSDIYLVVVGDGPELHTLESLAKAVGVSERVSFAGRVEEDRKWQLLRNADTYISATLHEGFGLVYLEAMAAGLPVVTPDHGGQSDFLIDGVTGYLVTSGDHDALARGLTELRSDPQKRRGIGIENQHRFETYRVENCAAAYEDLFRRVCQNHVGGSSQS